MTKILVVDDDPHILSILGRGLRFEGYEVEVAADGGAALRAARFQLPDLIILDVMLPDISGVDLCKRFRREGHMPILMLTARDRPEDVLRGFATGADDYLPKPFELSILIARVNGLLRRRRWNEQDASAPPEVAADTYAFAGRTLDFGAMEIRARGESYRLTQMECELLRYLVRNAGQAVSRGAILEEVWGLHEETDTRAIDNFIVRLRRYLEDQPDSPKFLQTVRGVGYRFVPGA